MTKSEIYDAGIRPLMNEIIRLAKERGLNFVAAFELDESEYCWTSIVGDPAEAARFRDKSEMIKEIVRGWEL